VSRFFAALYVSEIWHGRWRSDGCLFSKARAVVLFDRIIAGEDHRLRLNGRPLDEFIDGVES
jgi:hypothetical protein